MNKLLIYYHTIKYLKLGQLVARLQRRFIYPKVNQLRLKPREAAEEWIVQTLGKQKLLSNDSCIFLNKVGSINERADWNKQTEAKLWLYNLHYFDDLVAVNASERRTVQAYWINRWIDENTPGTGNAWEPYPNSLRIVNWIKAFLDGFVAEQHWLDSLATQADYLSQDLEYHLLGNHLFVNAKALIFAGCYFEGSPSEKWLKVGTKILQSELDEQILADGANFELTPMYHAIMLLDLLDLVNLAKAYPSRFPRPLLAKVKQKVPIMLAYLSDMSHLDGKLSFFNDTAWGIAPENRFIYHYAKRLGFAGVEKSNDELTIKDHEYSGYVTVKSPQYSLIADLSPIGPDYFPGHAHADTLSFELCLGDDRVIVNTGISLYGNSEKRLAQRKTSAHNTVVVEGVDSSEVWGGFRVARRARVTKREVDASERYFMGAHDGYQRIGAGLHERRFYVAESKINIKDSFTSFNTGLVGYLHLHPSVKIIPEYVNDNIFILQTKNKTLKLSILGAVTEIEEFSWCPEFGLEIPSNRIKYTFESGEVLLGLGIE